MHPWRSRRARRRSVYLGMDIWIHLYLLLLSGICEDTGLYKFISVPMVGWWFLCWLTLGPTPAAKIHGQKGK
jgi:hypothetical protein